MIHIKRDGTYLCLIGITDKLTIWGTKRNSSFLTYSDAIKAKELKNVCSKCCEKFYFKLNALKNPIQV